MTRFIEVLCEGSSDLPAVREVLCRRFGLTEDSDFKIHPHAGRGTLPTNLKAKPEPWRGDLLHQLPTKLRAYGKAESHACRFSVIVLVDADNDDWNQLERELQRILDAIESRPDRVLFRVAVEETESWFIAEPESVLRAYPQAKVKKLRQIKPDAVCGAWERLAEALGLEPGECDGGDKVEWASAIAPHLSLRPPRSPSLQRFLEGVESVILRDGDDSSNTTPDGAGTRSGATDRKPKRTDRR